LTGILVPSSVSIKLLNCLTYTFAFAEGVKDIVGNVKLNFFKGAFGSVEAISKLSTCILNSLSLGNFHVSFMQSYPFVHELPLGLNSPKLKKEIISIPDEVSVTPRSYITGHLSIKV
jgi:hypothetical protein